MTADTGPHVSRHYGTVNLMGAQLSADEAHAMYSMLCAVKRTATLPELRGAAQLMIDVLESQGIRSH